MIKSTIKLLLLTSIFFTQLSLNTFAMDEDLQEINRRTNIIQTKLHEYQQRIQSLEQERDDADKLIDHMISISKFISTDDPLRLNPDIDIKKISLTDNIHYSNHNDTGIYKNPEMENLLVQSQTRYNMNRKRMPVSPIRTDPQNLTLLRPTGQHVQQTTKLNELEEKKENLTDGVSPPTSEDNDELDDQRGKIPSCPILLTQQKRQQAAPIVPTTALPILSNTKEDQLFTPTTIPATQPALPNISTPAKDCPPKYTSSGGLTQIQFVTQESALDKMNREYRNHFEANDGAPFKSFDYIDHHGNGHYF